MNEEEVKDLIQSELDKFAQNFYRRNYPNFNITSGHTTLGHGESEFCVTTDTAQGIHFYNQGNCKMFARKSIELNAGDKSTDTECSISLRAEDGHIIIDATNGDLTLRGNNVIIETNQADGSIVSRPNKVFHVKAPEVELQGTKVTASATMDMLLSAGDLSLYAESGPPQVGDGTEPFIGGSVFATVFNALEKAKKFFG